LALFLVALLTIPAIVMGHVARRGLKRAPDHSGKGLATAGFVLGYLNIVLVIVLMHTVVLPWYSVWRVKLTGYSCQTNLRDVGLALKMYANENHDAYPMLSTQEGRLMFDHTRASLYPEYLQDLLKLTCPQDKDFEALFAKKDTPDPNALCNDHSYLYLGYAVTNDEEVAAFADAYRAQIAVGRGFAGDLPVAEGAGTGGANHILRLREDLAKEVLGTNATPEAAAKWTSQIPLLIERPENHVPQGGNVVYLDGHVEFLHHPGKWPMTDKTIGVLVSLAE
jgi:prepilin-type processing-associated H-X9-DG protein